MKRPLAAVALLPLVVLALGGCPSSPRALSLSVESGDGQSGVAGGALPGPLVVRVESAQGKPAAGVAIAWASAGGKDRLEAEVSITDENGRAQMAVTLGTAAGKRKVSASAEVAAGSPVTFTVEAGAGPGVAISAVRGGGQQTSSGAALGAPFVVRVADAFGNPAVNHKVLWSARTGGSIAPSFTHTGLDGLASAQATLGAELGAYSFIAKLDSGASVEFSARTLPIGLYYEDPPPGGKLRLVRNAASTPGELQLDLVAAQPLAGYYAGFNLPLDVQRVALLGELLPGTALDPGQGVVAARAALPSTGPLKGMLVVALSQKAAGGGARSTDASIAAGAVLLSVKLAPQPLARPGVVFDGRPAGFSGGLRDRAGTDVVGPEEFSVGRLEAR
ncbi:MAG: Ig-like domain-containing protein [Myxococcaceae bacterium]